MWFKQHSASIDNSEKKTRATTASKNAKKNDSDEMKTSDTRDIFRDGCKTIMSILVILTSDSGMIISQVDDYLSFLS